MQSEPGTASRNWKAYRPQEQVLFLSVFSLFPPDLKFPVPSAGAFCFYTEDSHTMVYLVSNLLPLHQQGLSCCHFISNPDSQERESVWPSLGQASIPSLKHCGHMIKVQLPTSTGGKEVTL